MRARRLLATLAICLAAPATAEVPLDDVFVEACVRPLLERGTLGTHPALGPETVEPASGRYSGREWPLGDGFWLKEMRVGPVVGCDLSAFRVRELAEAFESQPDKAGRVWDAFRRVSERLVAEGGFEDLGEHENNGVKGIAIRSFETAPSGRRIFAIVMHNTQHGFANMMAVEDDP